MDQAKLDVSLDVGDEPYKLPICAWCGHDIDRVAHKVDEAPHAPLCDRCYDRHVRGYETLNNFLKRYGIERIQYKLQGMNINRVY